MEDYRNEEVYSEEFKVLDTPLYMPLKAEYTEPETTQEHAEDTGEKIKKKRNFLPLISLQLIVCLLLAFCVFILKSMNSDVYFLFKNWYSSQMSYVFLNSDVFESIDLNEYLDIEKPIATDDEV